MGDNGQILARNCKACEANPESAAPTDSGEARLREMGYKQELRREWDVLSSFSGSLGLMACTTQITGVFPIAYDDGGAAVAVWGWIIVAAFNICMALSLAELTSSYPVAGGPYSWCLELLGEDSPHTLVAWITGWLNVLGQFARTAVAGHVFAQLLAEMWLLSDGHAFAPEEILLTYAIALVLAASLSSASSWWARQHALFAAAFLLFGTAAVVGVLLAVAPKLQSAHFVFLGFERGDAWSSGLPNLAYMCLLGTILPQSAFIGLELPAQFVEETKRADKAAPRAIYTSVIVTAICGFVYILTILFCIQDPARLDYETTNGYIVGQVFADVFQARFGSSTAGVFLLLIPLLTSFNALVLSLSTNARMLWAFARDRGVPLHGVWSAVTKCTGTPVNAVWAMAALAFLLGLPLMSPSDEWFNAIISIGSIGLYVSYGIPILLRIVNHKRFQPGPFKLGCWQLPVNIAALFWVVTSSVVFVLPIEYPVTAGDLNWTAVAVGVVLAAVLAAWFLPRFGASRWFRGKSHTLEDRTQVSAKASGKQQECHRERRRLPRLTLLHLAQDASCHQGSHYKGSAGEGPSSGAAATQLQRLSAVSFGSPNVEWSDTKHRRSAPPRKKQPEQTASIHDSVTTTPAIEVPQTLKSPLGDHHSSIRGED